ncbi:MAG TPA: flavin reductase family protein [Oligoflexia bacterium]|nr:flavin reductase family protein [Oligoflexia bacterium]HMP26767.1 flavin reductase family protein [Oligoflexia bacterium]
MLEFDPATLEKKDIYKLMIGAIIPRPIAWITSQNAADVINLAPFSYFNGVSSAPPMISVSFSRKPNGAQKDTLKNILHNHEFVAHIANFNQAKLVSLSAAEFEENQSELQAVGLKIAESKKISVPGFQESAVRFECKFANIVEIKKNGIITGELVLAEIVYFWIADSIYSDGRIDPKTLNPLARLAGDSYANLGEIINEPIPKLSKN